MEVGSFFRYESFAEQVAKILFVPIKRPSFEDFGKLGKNFFVGGSYFSEICYNEPVVWAVP